MKKTYLFTFFIAFYVMPFNVKAQLLNDTIVYDLIVDEEVIGDLIAIKSFNEDSTIHYVVLSNVDYTFLFSFHITFLYESMFSTTGKYTSSQFTYTMNDDLKESNWVNYIADKWYVYEDNEIQNIIEDQIHQTAVQLYFHEPDERHNVFSERYCDFYEIEKEEDDGYMVEYPGGTNRYYYKNGVCYKVAITTLLSDMEFLQRPY